MLDSSARSSDFPPGIQAGDVVANRYRLEEVIGRGGMGVVVAARHLELDERVAVKFMSPAALSDPEAISRFDREVRAAARVKSEYVARVYDAGKLPDGRRYMVCEYLEGEDLSVRLERDGPLGVEQAVRFILQASSAVLEAHRLGIVHRDLKPANLRVVRRADGSEIVKVLDFGVAKRMPGSQSEAETHETQPGTVVGTPLYTSPEQLRGSGTVDPRTDIWSLGTTLFELLTGKPPFRGTTYSQVIANVLEVPPRSLRSLRPEISESLESAVMRCLEKRPEDRHAGIVELASALAATIELDAEQRGLLERMLRHHRDLEKDTPLGLAATKRSEPTYAVAGTRPPPDNGAGTKQYQSRAVPERRMLLTIASALLTAILVVAIGLPWLPRFETKAPHAANSNQVPLTAPEATSEVPPAVAQPQATARALLPEVSPLPSSSSPATPIRINPAPAKSPQRRMPAPLDSPPVRTSDSSPQPQPPSQVLPARRKNPLLVHPR